MMLTNSVAGGAFFSGPLTVGGLIAVTALSYFTLNALANLPNTFLSRARANWSFERVNVIYQAYLEEFLKEQKLVREPMAKKTDKPEEIKLKNPPVANDPTFTATKSTSQKEVG